jgi:uncharacterized protein (TIGR02302 family)
VQDNQTVQADSVLDRAQKARLKFLIFASSFILLWEKILPFLLAPLAFIALFLVFSWSGLFASLPDIVARVFLLLLFFAGLASLIPLARQPFPRKKEVISRLDQQSSFRVVSTLSDKPGLALSAQSLDLWRLHRLRLAGKLLQIKLFPPKSDIFLHDRYGLRFALILCLGVAASIAGSERMARLRQALEGGTISAVPPRLDAWITPPAYTGRAPVFLDISKKDEKALRLEVPQGSIFALRTTSGQGVDLKINGGEAPTVESATDSKLVRFEQKLKASSSFLIQHYGRTLVEGEIKVDPDLAPQISLLEPPRVMLGKSLRLRVKVQDDYGVTFAEARFSLLEEKPAVDFRLNKNTPAQPLVEPPSFPLALGTSRPRESVINTIKDLLDHPYAGLPMALTLLARDDADNETKTAAGRIILPSRPFSKPVARALVALRQTLALDKRQSAIVVNALDLILREPEKREINTREYLQLSALHAQLLLARDDNMLRAVLERIWDVANYIENGDLTAAERTLAQAQADLEKAIENNASAEEISKLMQNLRQAMADYLKQLQNRAAQNAPNGKPPQNMKILTENDLEQIMRRIEQLSRLGAKDAARQQLQSLRDLLSALRNSDPSASGQASAMQQQLNGIAGLMHEQQKLMDKTFQERNRNRPKPGDNSKGAAPSAPSQNDSPALRELEQQQGELHEKLHGLQNNLPQGSEGANKAMNEAGSAMGDAKSFLGQNAPGGALPEQGRALESLRKGAQALMRDLKSNQGGSGKGYGFNAGEEGSDLDASARFNPFGMGDDLPDGNRVPDAADRKTIQDILDEVKRRLSDPQRSKPERDYLERLLRPF